MRPTSPNSRPGRSPKNERAICRARRERSSSRITAHRNRRRRFRRAHDFQPQNRIEVAREKVKQFVAMRKTDRIGVVAFSGEALTQVPLTTDYPVVNAAISNLQPGQLEDGTAIGTAIATAANRLKDAPGMSR